MNLISIIIALYIAAPSADAQETPFYAQANEVEEKLTIQNIDEVAKILHANVPAPNLRCHLKVRQIKQLRKFSLGEKLIEMIEVEYTSARDYDGTPMKAYFPEGSVLKRAIVNSEFSGPVEEITLKVDDRLGHTLTFQHDGRGHFVWGSMHNRLRLNPCLLHPF